MKKGCAPWYLDVARVAREFFLVLVLQRVRVARLGQQAIEELDVAGVELVVELVEAGMAQDERPALAQHGLAPIKLVKVA
jgi:hypothetical protein